ncbi:hypothetical protein BGZ96_001954 [Linnemannia gamsii]|uniref:FAD-binding PCMH-type domain-containing protein n=1 Tax=Linnemannia gamsii TaxID=64522 RepID=A0ABQ7K9V0_9FUNG|nr:hypothetical protein BGZ96_001954 [Linnemannia gamsii]
MCIPCKALPTGIVTCLQSIQNSSGSHLYTPSSSMYLNDRLGFNNIFDHKPSAIFHPGSEADAATVIVCAAAHNVSIAPRSGGHSFERYSGSGKDGSLVIDLSLFQQIAIEHDTGIATVGAGTRLGPLYTRLWNAGEYLVPAGSCPSVGICGHALRGGMGMVGRKYGMLSHNIVSLTMIDANGDILEISATSRPDLFWALRGAGGGSFGLVTEFRIQAYKAPATITTVVAMYPWSMHHVVMEAFGIWAKTATDDLTPLLYINHDIVAIMGTFLGPRDEANAVFKPLYELTGPPEHSAFNEGTWYAVAMWAKIEGSKVENPIAKHDRTYRSPSLLYRQPISDSEMTTFSRYLSSPPNNLNSRISSQTAHSSGPTLEAYQNYIERDIPNGLQAYYGDNMPRLIEIKKNVDPDNIFTFPQAIPLK